LTKTPFEGKYLRVYWRGYGSTPLHTHPYPLSIPPYAHAHERDTMSTRDDFIVHPE